jgi:hypothetical protein
LGQSISIGSLPAPSVVVVFLPHLAEFGWSLHQPFFSLFAVLARRRLIPEMVDHVTGHSGGLFSAPAGFSRFRRYSGVVQTQFR